jgi:hypothetical protein
MRNLSGNAGTCSEDGANAIISRITRHNRRIIVCPEAKNHDFEARVFPGTAVTLPASSFEIFIKRGKG